MTSNDQHFLWSERVAAHSLCVCVSECVCNISSSLIEMECEKEEDGRRWKRCEREGERRKEKSCHT